jgi:hypothetical protein
MAQEISHNPPGWIAVFVIWMVPVAMLAWKASMVITRSDRISLLIAGAVPVLLALILCLWFIWDVRRHYRPPSRIPRPAGEHRPLDRSVVQTPDELVPNSSIVQSQPDLKFKQWKTWDGCCRLD